MKRSAGILAALLLCGSGCGDDDVNDAPPTLIPEGGVGSGAVKGLLNVHVIDGDTGAAIAGASVRVGLSSDAAPLTGATDTTGLVTFRDGKLQGAQTITASASDHVTSTWIGANGANVTIPLAPSDAPAVATATVSGTIEGWADRPAPAQNHYTLGVILYSTSPDLGARENDIAQPTGTGGLPRNACIRSPVLNSCAWELKTRTGKQAHYAIIVDGDSKGTWTSFTDDTLTIVGFAVKRGLDLTADQSVTGEVLVPVAEENLADLTVTFQAAPAGLDKAGGAPILNLGDEGLMLLAMPFGTASASGPPFPGLTPAAPTTKVPTLAGTFADAKYDILARAAPANDDEYPSSTILEHGLTSASAPIDLGPWLPTPSTLSAAGGTYSFTPVEGVNLHTAEFYDSSGKQVWGVGIVDDSTEFTLPTLSPDPMPVGTVTMRVNAIDLPGFDPADFSLQDMDQRIARIAGNHMEFNR